MAEQQGGTILQFVPFVSRLETGFWHELGRRKLEKYKLSEEQQDIHGCYYNSEWLVTSGCNDDRCACSEHGTANM